MYTQELVLVTFHSYSALATRQNIAISHVCCRRLLPLNQSAYHHLKAEPLRPTSSRNPPLNRALKGGQAESFVWRKRRGTRRGTVRRRMIRVWSLACVRDCLRTRTSTTSWLCVAHGNFPDWTNWPLSLQPVICQLWRNREQTAPRSEDHLKQYTISPTSRHSATLSLSLQSKTKSRHLSSPNISWRHRHTGNDTWTVRHNRRCDGWRHRHTINDNVNPVSIDPWLGPRRSG